MTITSTCPGCGASLSIEDDVTEVTCSFCGSHFHVNLEGVAPAFRKTVPPPQPLERTISIESPPPGETPSLPPGGDGYNPPVPGQEVVAPTELYNPPIPPGGAAGSGEPPPPFSTPSGTIPSSRGRLLTGWRLWIAIGLVILAAFCLSCLCLLIAVERSVK